MLAKLANALESEPLFFEKLSDVMKLARYNVVAVRLCV